MNDEGNPADWEKDAVTTRMYRVRRSDIVSTFSLATLVGVAGLWWSIFRGFGDELKKHIESFENRVAQTVEQLIHRIERVEDRLERRR